MATKKKLTAKKRMTTMSNVGMVTINIPSPPSDGTEVWVDHTCILRITGAQQTIVKDANVDNKPKIELIGTHVRFNDGYMFLMVSEVTGSEILDSMQIEDDFDFDIQYKAAKEKLVEWLDGDVHEFSYKETKKRLKHYLKSL